MLNLIKIKKLFFACTTPSFHAKTSSPSQPTTYRAKQFRRSFWTWRIPPTWKLFFGRYNSYSPSNFIPPVPFFPCPYLPPNMAAYPRMTIGLLAGCCWAAFVHSTIFSLSACRIVQLCPNLVHSICVLLTTTFNAANSKPSHNCELCNVTGKVSIYSAAAACATAYVRFNAASSWERRIYQMLGWNGCSAQSCSRKRPFWWDEIRVGQVSQTCLT